MIKAGMRVMKHKAGGVRSLAVAVIALNLAAGTFATGAMAAEPKKIDVARGQQIAGQVCAACHAADGNGVAVSNPKLAAQHPEYLYKQLVNFVAGEGGKAPERQNAVMMAFASQLSEQDRRDVSAFYATQPLKPSVARDKSLVELGQKIYRAGIAEKGVPSCAGCHGPGGAGMPAQFPRLNGQYAEYTESQLVAFRGGQRRNSVQMMTISSRLSDREIKAVSDYLAGLR